METALLAIKATLRTLWLDALTMIGLTRWCHRCRLSDSVFYECTCSKRKETRNAIRTP